MTQPLLTPYRLGSLELPNRVVMAPMTRNRADNPENVPTQLTAKYYAQRAGAGLMISEGIFISRQAIGFINVPGLYTDAQTRAWQRVTASVHAAGGRILPSSGMSGQFHTRTCWTAHCRWPLRRSIRRPRPIHTAASSRQQRRGLWKPLKLRRLLPPTAVPRNEPHRPGLMAWNCMPPMPI